MAQEKKLNSTQNGYALLQRAKALPTSRAKEALELIEQALIEGLRTENLGLQAESYQLLGSINKDLNQFDLAMENYTKASQLYIKSGNNTGYLSTLKALGDLSKQTGKNEKALNYYQRYLALAEKKPESKSLDYDREEIPSKKRKVAAESKMAERTAASSNSSYKWSADKNFTTELDQVKLSMSEIYGYQKRYNESMDALNSVSGNSEENFYQTPSTETDLLVNELKGDLLEKQNKDDAALELYKINAAAANTLNKPVVEARANDKIADIYSEQNKIEQAIELRKRSINIYSRSGDQAGLSYELLQLGKLEIQTKSYPAATEHLKRAANLSADLKLRNIELDCWKTLSDLQELQNDKSAALASLKHFIQVQNTIISEKGEALDSNRTINSGVSRQLQQIELLEKNREINDKTIEILRKNEELNKQTLRNQLIVIFSLAGILVLISVLGYLMYRNIQQKKVANQLLALKSLRSQMNPHFIFNALNSVNHYIAQKDERSANKYLSEFSRLMRAVLEHSQKDFITLSVETDIMALYLKLEQDRFRDKFEYELFIDPKLQKEGLLIPPMLIQPFVENAIWHGLRYKDSIGFLSVHYLMDGDRVLIQIEDDGIGRVRSKELKTENQRKNSSTGILNISKRVEIINDMFSTGIKVDIQDKPNNSGTLVSIRFDQKMEQ